MTLNEYARKQGLVDGTGCLTPHALRVVGQNIIRLKMLDTPQPRLGKTWRETVRYLLHT